MQWIRTSVVTMLLAVFVKSTSFAQMCVLVGPMCAVGSTLALLMDEFGIRNLTSRRLLAIELRSTAVLCCRNRLEMQYKSPWAKATGS